ncbi:MAG: tetratricopeptide repeat protein [Cyanobacteria bacterium SIG30]|nr:tetratricopeptide repeat protein [Cyanobacteria bacterium SIG30]
MKKVIFTAILSSFFITGCIDNSAIEKLNNSAQQYLQKSETNKAVCMLEASLELNPNIYETRYNLGVAYIELKDYNSAIKNLKSAMEIKEDSPNTYYTLGVAFEGAGYEILDKSKNDEYENVEENKPKTKLSDDEIKEANALLESAIEAYETYIKKSPESEDVESVQNQIISIKNTISKYQEVK